jgi:hypothetical protein
MGQSHAADTLFEPPADRLGARLHEEVFGALPVSVGRALDVPQVASAVRLLLAARWRPAQLAARVGALPASADPVAAVTAFLEALRERDCPQELWERERAARREEQARRQEDGHAVASEQSRARWVAQARRALGQQAPGRQGTGPPPLGPGTRSRIATVPRPTATCASCHRPAAFFVTRQVRLCTGCVELLGSGRGQLVAAVG